MKDQLQGGKKKVPRQQEGGSLSGWHILVREGGIEPPSTHVGWILSPVRLPVPPLSPEPEENNQLFHRRQVRSRNEGTPMFEKAGKGDFEPCNSVFPLPATLPVSKQAVQATSHSV